MKPCGFENAWPAFWSTQMIIKPLGGQICQTRGWKVGKRLKRRFAEFSFLCIWKSHKQQATWKGRGSMQSHIGTVVSLSCDRCVFRIYCSCHALKQPYWRKPGSQKKGRRLIIYETIPWKPQERIPNSGGETSNLFFIFIPQNWGENDPIWLTKKHPEGLVPTTNLEIPLGIPKQTPWKNEGRKIIKNP